MDRYICIHGHFYQPPRENPWLEEIEVQDSAWPYHDWNERITAECYAPNGASRILDDKGRIARIVNNYAHMSFNFGPTVLSWLHDHQPDVLRLIVRADRESLRRFSGHGSAMAQAYSHPIMPLCNARDQRTQVRWGLADFEHRFGRKAEGMWLPEAAVDLASLEVLAAHEVRFTVLAPRQARRIRPLSGGTWQDVSDGRIDPTRPYLQKLPSGRSIALFFYDGPVSQAVAFEQLLGSGERFASRLLEIFDERRRWPQIAHIATDGETYGHHFRHGDMALAYALSVIEERGLAKLTNYGEYLERHPPTHQVDIFEDSSWSCIHGVERWRAACGCASGMHGQWNQRWRAPLREALDELRDALVPRYEQAAAALVRDPWEARDDYIQVVLDRSPERVDAFLGRHASRALDRAERVRLLELLELQRHAMLMYTSCGWFFDELSGIETVQVLQYAGRAVQLAEKLFEEPFEEPFLQRLEKAESNLPDWGNGRQVWARGVRPAMVDLDKVAAHYAVSFLFETYEEHSRIYGYRADLEHSLLEEAGKARLALGQMCIASEITGEKTRFTFAALHLGDHNLSAGVRRFVSEQAYDDMVREVTEAFSRADLPGVLRLIDRHFAAALYALPSLFTDEQRRVLDLILEDTVEEVEAEYRQIVAHHGPLMRFLAGLGQPLPGALRAAATYVVESELRRALEDDFDLEAFGSRMAEARALDLPLETEGLAYGIAQGLIRLCDALVARPHDVVRLRRLREAAEMAREAPFEVDCWQVQNRVYRLAREVRPVLSGRTGDPGAQAWLQDFDALAAALNLRVA